MPTENYYSVSGVTEMMNQAKELIITELQNDGIISDKYDTEKLAASYIVVLRKKGMFGKLFDKVFKTEKDSTYITPLRTKNNIKEFCTKTEEIEEKPLDNE